MNTSEIPWIGASLGSFAGLTLEQGMELYLRLADDFNLSAVEIRLEREEGRPSMWSWEVDKKIADFLAKFEVKGAHLPFIYLNLISPNPGIREESRKQLKSAIAKASELNVDYAVMHATGTAYGLTLEQQTAAWTEVIAELADHAEKHSITLAVENGDSLADLKRLAGIVRATGSKYLKLTLDAGHAYTRTLPHLSTYPVKALTLRVLDMTFMPMVIKEYLPFAAYGSLKNFVNIEYELISAVHVHDFDGKRAHVAIGDGKMNFSFLSALRERGFQGPLILEAEFHDHYQDFKKNYERLQHFYAGNKG